MAFDQDSWRFPIDKLVVKAAYLCLMRPDGDDGETIMGGCRIEFEAIALPDINYDYERDEVCELDLQLNFERPFADLASLAGTVLKIGEVEELGDDLGSIYAFSAHNPVDWTEIRFGEVSGETIEASFDLVLDFEFESDFDRIAATLDTVLRIERRWAL